MTSFHDLFDGSDMSLLYEHTSHALEVMDCGNAVGRTPEVLPICKEKAENFTCADSYVKNLSEMAGALE